MSAGLAVARLQQDGERVFAARAVGIPEEAIPLKGI
jgi:hypothetical protein